MRRLVATSIRPAVNFRTAVAVCCAGTALILWVGRAGVMSRLPGTRQRVPAICNAAGVAAFGGQLNRLTAGMTPMQSR